MPAFLKSWTTAEPVRLHALVAAVLTVLAAFGLALTAAQTAAILGLAAVVFGVQATVVRKAVTPNATAEADAVNAASVALNVGAIQGAHAGLEHPDEARAMLAQVAPKVLTLHEDHPGHVEGDAHPEGLVPGQYL